jgi:hypothetical protein
MPPCVWRYFTQLAAKCKLSYSVKNLTGVRIAGLLTHHSDVNLSKLTRICRKDGYSYQIFAS